MDTMGCQHHLHSENVLWNGLVQRAVAVLSVPIPRVLQKGQITAVSRSFQLTCVQMCLATVPGVLQPQAEAGKV